MNIQLARPNLPLLAILFCSTTFAAQASQPEDWPAQMSSALPTRAAPPLDIADHVSRDWQKSRQHSSSNAPDRGYGVVWVRVFPIISVPLSDPYPQTANIHNISFESTRPLEIRSLGTGQVLGRSSRLDLDFSKATFKIGNSTVPLEPLWVTTEDGHLTTLRWDRPQNVTPQSSKEVGLKVRGQFVIKPTVYESDGNGKPQSLGQQLWSVINTVAIDDYIRSVVPSEVISSWATETLKAQAIAARTYGLYEIAEARSRQSPWDVDPTTWFQSYQGVEFWDRQKNNWRKIESEKTTLAVNATLGEVITHQGQVIKAYFSANSGGVTCTASECFNLPDQPYLHQVADANGIRKAPGGTWGSKANLTAQSIYDRLVMMGIQPKSPVDRIESLRRGQSGRTWQLRVHLRSGATIDLTPLETRRMMSLFGPIRSFLYTLGQVEADGKQSVVGHGFGHGVGLSQWGAQLFAAEGWSAHRILRYYYHKVEISKL